MTLFALLFSVIVGAASLAWGFSSVGLTSAATWMLIIGAVWLLAIRQRWDWYSSFGLLIFVIAAAFGLWLDIPSGWMFSGGLFALFAWDMNDFRQRLRFILKDDNARAMERRHLARTSLLALAGLFLASLTMLARGQFTFYWKVFLAVIILTGLAQLTGWIKKQN
ncbi:MAG: hypothetical protein PHQ36_07535 [Anaerolineales bacterium]|nr:hypothetical protein [Anaerolineales bacterium]